MWTSKTIKKNMLALDNRSLVIAICFILDLNLCASFKIVEKDMAKIMKFEVCDKRKYVIKLLKTELKNLNRVLMGMDLVLDVTEDIGNITKQTLQLYKCRSFSERESCELFTTIKHCETCSQLKERNQIWSNLVYSFSPPFQCPINKGRYVMINGTLDTSALVRTPGMKGFYWEVKQRGFSSDGKLVFCYVLGMEIRRLRYQSL